jgi:protein gp37
VDKIRTALGKSVAGFIEAGQYLKDAKEGPRKLPHGEFIPMVEDDLNMSRSTSQHLMRIAEHSVISNDEHAHHLPPAWYTLAILTRLTKQQALKAIRDGSINPNLERKDALALVKALSQDDADAGDDKEKDDEEKVTSYVTLEKWNRLGETKRQALLETAGDTKLNKQDNESIGWARWSWNPITGCLHNCPYCYARDIAERWYEQGFVPTLHPSRLAAPQNTKIEPGDDVAERNIFTGSMADIFGRWVPEPWIDAVMQSVLRSPQLNFLFLTKFPKRMIDREVPNNVWLGATVDKQARVKVVEDAFAQVPAHTRWLSLEPLLEPLQFNRPELFKWVVIGGASPSSQTPAWNPPFTWVIDLYRQFKEAGAAVYFKTNIGFDGGTVPREFPWQVEIEQKLPREFNYRGNQ